MSERRSSPTQTPSRGHQQRVSMRRCACRTGIHAWPDGTFGPPACVCPVWWAAWRVGGEGIRHRPVLLRACEGTESSGFDDDDGPLIHARTLCQWTSKRSQTGTLGGATCQRRVWPFRAGAPLRVGGSGGCAKSRAGRRAARGKSSGTVREAARGGGRFLAGSAG